MLPRLREGSKSADRQAAERFGESSSRAAIVPPERVRYLAEIADSVRAITRRIERQARVARERQSLKTPSPVRSRRQAAAGFDELVSAKDRRTDRAAKKLLEQCQDPGAVRPG